MRVVLTKDRDPRGDPLPPPTRRAPFENCPQDQLGPGVAVCGAIRAGRPHGAIYWAPALRLAPVAPRPGAAPRPNRPSPAHEAPPALPPRDDVQPRRSPPRQCGAQPPPGPRVPIGRPAEPPSPVTAPPLGPGRRRGVPTGSLGTGPAAPGPMRPRHGGRRPGSAGHSPPPGRVSP